MGAEKARRSATVLAWGRGQKDGLEQLMTGTSQLILQEKGETATIHKLCMRSCRAGQGPQKVGYPQRSASPSLTVVPSPPISPAPWRSALQLSGRQTSTPVTPQSDDGRRKARGVIQATRIHICSPTVKCFFLYLHKFNKRQNARRWSIIPNRPQHLGSTEEIITCQG
jgi:hypothetical protein